MEPSPQDVARPRRPGRSTPSLLLWGRDLIVSLIISAFIIVFLYQPVKVEGTSMLPGLDDQERIFINKFVYRRNPSSGAELLYFVFPATFRKATFSELLGWRVISVALKVGGVKLYAGGFLYPT